MVCESRTDANPVIEPLAEVGKMTEYRDKLKGRMTTFPGLRMDLGVCYRDSGQPLMRVYNRKRLRAGQYQVTGNTYQISSRESRMLLVHYAA